MDLEADGDAYELGLDAEAAAEDADFQAGMAAAAAFRDVGGILLPNFSAFRPPRLSQGGAAGQRAGQSPAPTSRCACWILLACDGTAVQMFRRLPVLSSCYPIWIQRLVRCPSQTHCCA